MYPSLNCGQFFSKKLPDPRHGLVRKLLTVRGASKWHPLFFMLPGRKQISALQSIPKANNEKGTETESIFERRKSEIHFLVFHRDSTDPKGELLVYLDKKLEIWWECDLSEKCEAILPNIRNAVAAIEPLVFSWPYDLKFHCHRLLAEGYVNALLSDREKANESIEQAREFVAAKSSNVSRYWILQTVLISACFLVLSGFLALFFRDILVNLISGPAYKLAMCFWSGCLGAVMFIVLGFSSMKNPMDVQSDRALHHWEGLARLVGGGLGGVLAGAMVEIGLILPFVADQGSKGIAMCTLAMVAGASERFACGIITQVESLQISREGRGHDSPHGT